MTGIVLLISGIALVLIAVFLLVASFVIVWAANELHEESKTVLNKVEDVLRKIEQIEG